MSFTKITNENAVVAPAVEEKIYDKLFIKNLRFVSDSVGKTLVAGNLIPFDGENEILEAPIKPIVIENIFEAMEDENRPEQLRTKMAQTMELVFQVVVEELAYQKEVATELPSQNEEDMISEE